MYVRPLRQNESGPYGFLKSPVEATSLSIPAQGLLNWLLANGRGYSGPIERVGQGLSQQQALAAAAELRAAGYLGYVDRRGVGNRLQRIVWVTALAWTRPEEVDRLVSSGSQQTDLSNERPETRRNRVSAGRAGTWASRSRGDVQVSPVSAGQDAYVQQVSARPAETSVSAARGGQVSEVSARPAATRVVPGQTVHPGQVSARPAETHPGDTVSAGRGGGPSRARLPSAVKTEEEDSPSSLPTTGDNERGGRRSEEVMYSAREVERAYRILETLRRFPVYRGSHVASEIAGEIAQRLANGIPEAEIYAELDRGYDRIPDSPEHFILGRIKRFKLHPSTIPGVRQARTMDELREHLDDVGAPLRTGEQGAAPSAAFLAAKAAMRERKTP